MTESTAKIKVLSIEDQPDIQFILKLSLENSGHFTVDGAATGAEGLAMAVATIPDLIILDYSLPDMDGPEILDQLKAAELTRHIPVIMLTAKTSTLNIDDCRQRGAIDIMIKPFMPKDIGKQILAALDRAKVT